MSSEQREGWPHQPAQSHNHMPRPGDQASRPTGQGPSYGPNASPHQQNITGPSVLPPPSSSYYSASAMPNGPGLPSLSGITHSPSDPSQSRAQMQPEQNTQPQPVQPQPLQYALPSLVQSTSQQPMPVHSSFERDREMQAARERDARQREYDQGRREQHNTQRDPRDREMREPQQQPTPQLNHAEPIQLHQPVAVVPQIRSVHGPNGLLGSGPPPNLPNPPQGPPTAAASLFGPQFDRGPQNNAQPSQAPMQNMVPLGVMQGINQLGGAPVAPGQQPILNDALSYLDQVKVQFAGEQNVYNQFLDIMKDFKSQTIDTPGVIRRVSTLFAGNPPLIQGFNTFLPPGYRIECGLPDDPNAIRVTTPMGTTVSPMGSAIRPPPANSHHHSQLTDSHLYDAATQDWNRQRTNEAHQVALYGPQGDQQARQSPFDPATAQDHPQGINHALLAHQQEQRGISQLQNAISAAPGEPLRQPATGLSPNAGSTTPLSAAVNGGVMAQQNGAQGMEKKGPVEFNHAISYVNKIKNRFSSQPEIYKQFLEILQTYQRESKPIQDVYAQVTTLFDGAPDLLEDFKQFLPESAAHAKAAAARQEAEDATTLSNLRDGGSHNVVDRTPRPEQHRLPPVGNFAPTPSAGRDQKRKRERPANTSSLDYNRTDVMSSKNGYGPNKRNKQAQAHLPPQQQQQTQTTKYATQATMPDVAPTLVPALPQPLAPSSTTAPTVEELSFFERVKKHIGNKGVMSDFLKLCNLYSQDLIDKNLLIFRAQSFIGTNPELFEWFKKFLAFDGRDTTVDNRTRPVSGRVNLNNCRSLGQSYREMPKRERLKPCSGRDEMCSLVLNDQWVSHPTWASEDSGFVAHKKNVHEESLHRIEEERHDYDINIASIERAIQTLEPYAQQIKMQTDEERMQWTLTQEFTGPIYAIFKKVFAKIYGRDNAQGIIDDLMNQPAHVIPVVLTRFKKMTEQWKAGQREWEKVWRDQTQKMFWKSLDHQGIQAKLGDKRQFQTRTLTNEISVKYEEQKRQRAAGMKNIPLFQAKYKFDDEEVLLDASRLLLISAEQGNVADAPRLLPFIKEFIPLFFGFNPDTFQDRMQLDFDATSQLEDEELSNALEDSTDSRGRKLNGRKGDLRRDVLSRGRSGKTSNESAGTTSRASTPDVASDVDEEMGDAADEAPIEEPKASTWIDHAVHGNTYKTRDVKPNEPFKRKTYSLYANLPIYCFFRMFTILYERLHNLKMNEQQVHDSVRRAKAPKAAIELKMIDRSPENFFQDTSPNANYYKQMLSILEEVVRSDTGTDMPYVEDILRRFYLHNGWMLYNFDKMLGSLVRFALAVLNGEAKDRSWDILQLFLKDRRKEMTTHQDELVYRRQVEKYVKEGDIYRLTFDQSFRTVGIRILKRDEETFDSVTDEGLLTPEQRWSHYITSYTSLMPTESIPKDDMGAISLQRNMRLVRKASESTLKGARNHGASIEHGDVEDDQEAGPDGSRDKQAERRVGQLYSKESLFLRISPETYAITWSKGSADEYKFNEEWWMEAPQLSTTAASTNSRSQQAKDAIDQATTTNDEPKTAEAGETGVEHHGHDHDGDQMTPYHEFEEKFVLNNRWMAGLTRDEVDKQNAEYRMWAAGTKDGEDVAMAEEL